ncbi:DUF998 domain-containing protein [Streptomyces tuirus]|uniref:DUF998 domain-containing protein n=1 Tax=Streptomyces tuirus TaxID=68278 RepID=A0A941F9I1_9ACTN|nr:DUF998 domain-containing protein [Streptomyces tuirus]
MAAGPLFTVAYLREDAGRADCKPFRHPVSSLALGRAGWAQTVNFLLTGLLSLLFAVGLWRTGPSSWGALLIGVWAVDLLGAGACRADPVRGYPAGTPDLLDRQRCALRDHDGAGQCRVQPAATLGGSGRTDPACLTHDRLDLADAARRAHSAHLTAVSYRRPGEPGSDPAHGRLERLPPAGGIHAVTCGHQLFVSPHNSR